MKIRELLDSPEKWTQGAFARDASGVAYWDGSDDCVCWCLAGAMRKCYPNEVEQENVRQWIKGEIDHGEIAPWNDDPKRTYADVISLVEKLDI